MILLPLCFIWTNLACIMMIGTMCEVLHMLYKGKHHMWLWIAWDSRAMNLLPNSLQFLRKQFFFPFFWELPTSLNHNTKTVWNMDYYTIGVILQDAFIPLSFFPFFFFLFQVRKEKTYQFCWVTPETKKVLPLFIPLFFFSFFFM